MTIELKSTSRGFIRGDFVDANGEAASIQESSIATQAMLWLGLNTGMHRVGECMARMHLTQELARELLPLLAYFVQHGQLVDEPEEVRILMEGISEEHYFAGWMMGLEQALWRVVFEDGNPHFGTGAIAPAAIQELKLRAERANTWWHWPEHVHDGPERITLDEARKLYGKAQP